MIYQYDSNHAVHSHHVCVLTHLQLPNADIPLLAASLDQALVNYCHLHNHAAACHSTLQTLLLSSMKLDRSVGQNVKANNDIPVLW